MPQDLTNETDDAQVNWVEEPKLGLTGKMYLPLIFSGLVVTTKHLFGPKMTVSFPEQRPEIGNPLIYRGVHRLNKDEQGRVKCGRLLPVRHGLPGPLHRHHRRAEPLARPR